MVRNISVLFPHCGSLKGEKDIDPRTSYTHKLFYFLPDSSTPSFVWENFFLEHKSHDVQQPGAGLQPLSSTSFAASYARTSTSSHSFPSRLSPPLHCPGNSFLGHRSVLWVFGFRIQAHWLAGLTFHYIDTRELLSAYKLHTPAEYLKKNRASRRDVVKFALIQQAAHCIIGYYMADDTELFYADSYGIATWARRVRQVQCFVSPLVHIFSFGVGSVTTDSTDSRTALGAKFVQESFGTCLNNATQTACAGGNGSFAAYSSWEWAVAEIIYSIIVPLLQFLTAMVLADTLQYFTHRAFHVNKWLYSKSRRNWVGSSALSELILTWNRTHSLDAS